MLLEDLRKKKLIHPPDYLPDNTHYLTIMGSVAYGVSSDTSDMDVYGFAIPPKAVIFPHLSGEIPGFGRQTKRFDQWQQHHIKDESAMGGKGREYDFSVYNIVRYFQLTMENNPNMVDSLFTPVNCVLHSTKIAQTVRDRRRTFLHKGAWHTYRGYAYSQLHKMDVKPEAEEYQGIWAFERDHEIPQKTTYDEVKAEFDARDKNSYGDGPLGKLTLEELKLYDGMWQAGMQKTGRFQGVKVYGADWKFGYHIVRLIMEAEQILVEGDIDLQRHREMLKDIRRGNWTVPQMREWFTKREGELNEVYKNSSLRHSPDEGAIKELLLNCLEEHYGSLDQCVVREDEALEALRQIKAVIDAKAALFG